MYTAPIYPFSFQSINNLICPLQLPPGISSRLVKGYGSSYRISGIAGGRVNGWIDLESGNILI